MEFDNVLKYIEEHFGKNFGKTDIVNREIPIEIQMEFVEVSNKGIINSEEKIDKEEFMLDLFSVLEKSVEIEDIKEILVFLSNCKNPKAYRVLENFEKQASEDVKDWAYLALRASRMKLESYLLEKNAVLVSSGLGGKDGKLRYFVVLFSVTSKDFNQTQIKILEKELDFFIDRENGEIEYFKAQANFVKMEVLLRLDLSLRQFFRQISNSCKELGIELNDNLLITNVKVLNDMEIKNFILKNIDD